MSGLPPDFFAVLDDRGARVEQMAAAAAGLKYTASDTWQKPQGARLVFVVVVSGGGGGGGGVANAANRSGGAGGGGGAVAWMLVPAFFLTDSEPITVGLGGAGGAPGVIGANGGDSVFGQDATGRPLLKTGRGFGGGFGVAAPGAVGGKGGSIDSGLLVSLKAGLGNQATQWDSTNGAYPTEWGGACGAGGMGIVKDGGSSLFGGPGGGAGGDNNGGVTGFGSGGDTLKYSVGSGGSPSGTWKIDPTPFCGSGGNGGNGVIGAGAGSINGGPGGAGAGGGGGGSSTSGTPGTGGAGGNGYVLVAVIY